MLSNVKSFGYAVRRGLMENDWHTPYHVCTALCVSVQIIGSHRQEWNTIDIFSKSIGVMSRFADMFLLPL